MNTEYPWFHPLPFSIGHRLYLFAWVFLFADTVMSRYEFCRSFFSQNPVASNKVPETR